MKRNPVTENFDWTFEQLSDLEKVDALVTEAIDRLSSVESSWPEGSHYGTIFVRLHAVKEFIDADLATVPASMRPEVV